MRFELFDIIGAVGLAFIVGFVLFRQFKRQNVPNAGVVSTAAGLAAGIILLVLKAFVL